MKIIERLNNMKVGMKLALSFAIVIILLVSIAVTGYVNMKVINDGMTTMYKDRLVPISQLGHAEAAFYQVRGELYKFILISDERNLIETELNAQIAVVEDNMKAYENSYMLPEETDELARYKLGWAAYQDAVMDIIAVVKAGNEIQAKAMLASGSALFNARIATSTSMDNLIKINLDHANETNKLAHATFASSTGLLVGLSAVALILALVLSFFLSLTIARPLDSVAKYAQQIAAGDLTIKIPANLRIDEIGQVIEAFRQMIELLRRSFAEIAQVVSQLSASASEILASTTQVAASTTETATAISETTTTVEEVRQAAQLSAQKAQYVSNNALIVAKTSQDGQQAVDETIVGMDRTREQMDVITQSIVKLGEQSQTIGGIIASVTDIANQSNLLAVNAAIEAAKAGDQGKGFTVVAQEIKSLAEQSKQATMQVRSILSDVQKATSNAAMSTEQGGKAVNASVTLASQAGESIKTLAKASNEAVEAAIQIVTSSQQQMVGMDQIGMAMENINQAGIQNVSSMKQLEVAAHSLLQFGNKLQDLLAHFKNEE